MYWKSIVVISSAVINMNSHDITQHLYCAGVPLKHGDLNQSDDMATMWVKVE
jgi:hypothetical protein